MTVASNLARGASSPHLLADVAVVEFDDQILPTTEFGVAAGLVELLAAATATATTKDTIS